jgi:O-antigen biosynthesis protein WbqV
MRKGDLAFLHDVIVAGLSFGLAMYLRLGDLVLGYYSTVIVYGTPIFALIAAASFRALGMYRGIWRYASVADIVSIVKAVTLAILVFVFASLLINRLDPIPRSVPIIQWMLLVFMLGAPRLAYRLWKDARLQKLVEVTKPSRIPVLLFGAGDASELFIRATEGDKHAGYRAVGLMDERDRRVGRSIHGVPVLGRADELEAIVALLDRRGDRPQRLIIAERPADGGASLGPLINRAECLGLTVARLPSPTEFKEAVGRGKVELRPIAIEDLLGRPQTALDLPAIGALIAGKRVMVTGAGGTIGSELTRQIADFGPAELLLVDLSEFSLYEIDLQVRESRPQMRAWPILCDVRDRDRIDQLFDRHRPELVFHAAALKHVPLVELNACEGVLTNAIGSRNVADAARAHGALAMVQISTDKAVNPAGIMGASKRLAESYCQSLDLADGEPGGSDGARPTRFLTVRFGNVLGSSGSVVPLFRRQLEQGGPLTVTHPEIKRFFMTVREAVGLVLQASALGIARPEERGRIFVLDMGEPIKIVDIARQLIRLSGLRPGLDVPIEITGLRPGEKLYEELFQEDEVAVPTEADGVLGAMPVPINLLVLRRAFDELEASARRGDAEALRRLIGQFVPSLTAKPAEPQRLAGAPGRPTGSNT